MPDTSLYTVVYPDGHRVSVPAKDTLRCDSLRADCQAAQTRSKKAHEDEVNLWLGRGLMLLLFILPFSYVIFSSLFRQFKHMGAYFFSSKKKAAIAAILEDKFPYYRRLTADAQRKFLRRVLFFKKSKWFHFKNLPYDREICYLISAAGVQLTFGLKEYLLPYFRHIHVLDDEYRLHLFNSPLQGHITDGHIYFSWKHFYEGLRIENDKQNVGLHEMAHALTFQNFNTGGEGDTHFREDFPFFSFVARPLFYRMNEGGESNLLGAYAATNYHEFWATGVEVFFEQPHQMKAQLPELYRAYASLLKQDPVQTVPYPH